MKRINVLLGSLVIGGLLLTGCGTNEDEPKSIAKAKAAEIENTSVESVNESTRMTKLKEIKVEATEYSTLEDFMNSLAKHWAEGSEYRKVGEGSEYTLANATVAYVNYFKPEITELRLNEDFDEFQLLADDVVQNDSESNLNKFEIKMKELHDKVTKSKFDNIEDWAAYAHDILSNPLIDYRLNEAKNDEGFEYYLKAKEVYKEFPIHLIDKDKEAEELHSKVFLATSEIQHLQYARTAHLGTEALETYGLVDEWEETPDDMRKAYKELASAVNEIVGK